MCSRKRRLQRTCVNQACKAIKRSASFHVECHICTTIPPWPFEAVQVPKLNYSAILVIQYYRTHEELKKTCTACKIHFIEGWEPLPGFFFLSPSAPFRYMYLICLLLNMVTGSKSNHWLQLSIPSSIHQNFQIVISCYKDIHFLCSTSSGQNAVFYYCL